MLNISAPLSAGTISAYFRSEFAVANSSYYFEKEELHGEYHGKLAEVFGLAGQQVTAEAFDRLALGQDPRTGEQLIKHRNTSVTKAGGEVAHVAGWDLCLSPGKSVSVTALAGGDTRIMDAHRAAVSAALRETEGLIQARAGGNASAFTTAKMMAAVFHHSTARPVDGYQSCQVHSHAIVFNLSEDRKGQARSINPHEIFIAKRMIGGVYQNHLEIELCKLGYQTERGKGATVEIVGYTPEYLASESKRSKQIEDEMEEKGVSGARASHIAAKSTRGEKLNIGPEEIRAAHLANALAFGNQPQKIVAEAAAREAQYREEPRISKSAVDFSRNKLSERNAVFDHHQVLAEALWFARGRVGLAPIKAEIDRQKAEGQFIAVKHVRPHAPLWRYSTPELIADERWVIEKVKSSPEREPINWVTDEVLEARYPIFNDQQRRVIRESLGSEKQISAINGAVGAGKTTLFSAVQEIAKENGWQIVGLAPSSKAVRALRDAGVENSETLQRFLLRTEETVNKRVFFVDESSLAGTREMRQFLEKIGESDRVIFCGDWRQHGSVTAGRAFEQLQLSGMETARVNRLVRQLDEGLKEVVKCMARGEIKQGVTLLDQQNRITEVEHRGERFQAIAKAYATEPHGTLIISPDNASRAEISTAVRRELKEQKKLGPDVFKASILVPRQEVTMPDRIVAGTYEIGDIILYRRGSKQIGVKAKEYGAVIWIDRDANEIKVKTEAGKIIKYNPERLKGVSLYTPEIRQFAEGDRLGFTAVSRKLSVANRDAGTIQKIDKSGNVELKLDDGRLKRFNLNANKHIEHSYVSTSHSAQSMTVSRVLVHVDAGDSRLRALINQTLGYVGLSRARNDAHVFTNSKADLVEGLSRKEEKTMALSPKEIHAYRKGMAA